MWRYQSVSLKKVMDNEMAFDGSSIDGFVEIDQSDMKLHPDLDTWLIFPWKLENGDGKIARFICDVHMPDGQPFQETQETTLNVL